MVALLQGARCVRVRHPHVDIELALKSFDLDLFDTPFLSGGCGCVVGGGGGRRWCRRHRSEAALRHKFGFLFGPQRDNWYSKSARREDGACFTPNARNKPLTLRDGPARVAELQQPRPLKVVLSFGTLADERAAAGGANLSSFVRRASGGPAERGVEPLCVGEPRRPGGNVRKRARVMRTVCGTNFRQQTNALVDSNSSLSWTSPNQVHWPTFHLRLARNLSLA